MAVATSSACLRASSPSPISFHFVFPVARRTIHHPDRPFRRTTFTPMVVFLLRVILPPGAQELPSNSASFGGGLNFEGATEEPFNLDAGD